MALGIDVGGTNILAVRVKKGGIQESWKFKTKNSEVIKIIGGIIEESAERIVGIGVPCYLKNGICVKAPNIPELNEKDLKNYFKNVVVMNDCTSMAYGEYALRGGKYDPLLLVALGTGVGAGLVFKGMPYIGNGSAMELGHIKRFSKRQCPCGKTGCFETVAGGKYVDVKENAKRAKEGYKEAIEFMKNYGRIIGKGLSYAIQLLDPEIVVIGGGISNAYELFAGSMKEELAELLSFIDVDDIIFERAKDEYSGALGAALISERKLL